MSPLSRDNMLAPSPPVAERLHPVRDLMLALGITLLIFLSSLGGWAWYRDVQGAQQRRIELDALWLEQGVADALQTHQNLLVNWVSDLDLHDKASVAALETRLSAFLGENRAVLSVDLLDAKGDRAGGQPAGGSPRNGSLPPLTDPSVVRTVEFARVTRAAHFGPVIEQGAAIWPLAMPLADGLGGSVLVTYDLDLLLEQIVPWWFAQRYRVSVVGDDSGRILAPRDLNLRAESDEFGRHRFGPEGSSLSLWLSPQVQPVPQTLLTVLAAIAALASIFVVWLLALLRRWTRQRNEARATLHDELRFRFAMERSLITGLVAYDRTGQIVYANAAAARMLGVERSSLVGLRAPFRFWADTQLQECSRLHAEMLEGRSPEGGQTLALRHADGTDLSVRTFSAPLLDDDGVQYGWVSSLYDRTFEQAAEGAARERDEALQRTSQMAGLAELASGIAHEINQPLSAIVNYVAVAESRLQTDPLNSDRLKEVIDSLGMEAARAGSIVQGLRRFIQRREIEHRRHCAADLVRRATALLQTQSKRAGVNIAYGPMDETLEIDGDGVMLEQVLFNLLRNAIEAVQAGHGRTGPDAVVISLMQRQDCAVFEVADRGCGIDEGAELFQAFKTTKADGMGLGLSICRTVVEGHGGHISARRRPEGGSVFAVQLPLRRDHAASVDHSMVLPDAPPSRAVRMQRQDRPMVYGDDL